MIERIRWAPGQHPLEAFRVGDTVHIDGRIGKVLDVETTGRDDLDRLHGILTVDFDEEIQVTPIG